MNGAFAFGANALLQLSTRCHRAAGSLEPESVYHSAELSAEVFDVLPDAPQLSIIALTISGNLHSKLVLLKRPKFSPFPVKALLSHQMQGMPASVALDT